MEPQGSPGFSKSHFTFICIVQAKELRYLPEIRLASLPKENKASVMTSESYRSFFKFLFIDFRESERKGERDRERNIDFVVPLIYAFIS